MEENTKSPLEPISPSKARAKKYIGIYLSVILFIVSFGLGVLVGQTWYVRKQVTNDQGEVDVNKVIDINRSVSHSDTVDFNQFWQVWDLLKQKYVKQPVKDTDLFYGAVQGMVMAMGDPYSVYFPPKAADEFSKDLSGELEGIGAEVGVKNNDLLIIAPLPDTPAEKAGLRPGDKILAIDKESTIGMDVNTAVQKIRGKEGTKVTLTIVRNGAKPEDITITRAKINVPSVTVSFKDDNVAYVRIMQFNDSTTEEFDKTIGKIQANGSKKMILDLRSNPGGYLQAAIAIGSEWIKDGIIVSEKTNVGDLNSHETIGDHRLAGIKTIVLVNGGSASASEIVAGALQDHKQATIIGEKTFGKGSVQDYQDFPDGSALKMTIAEWYTPNGKNINKEGITPDMIVKEDWEKEKIGEDIMIQKAMDLLSGKITITSTSTASGK